MIAGRSDTELNNSNTVHRHEPPITVGSILVLHIDREREFIVISKPGSMVGHYLLLGMETDL